MRARRLLTDRLGRAYHAEAYFRPYLPLRREPPGDRGAPWRLRADQRLGPADIGSVRAAAAAYSRPVRRRSPSCWAVAASEANFSQRFACANALLHGSFRQEHYDPSALRPGLGLR